MTSVARPGYRRVLLQMDTSTHCREALDVAVEIAASLRVELQGIFIEDSDLISVGGLDFVREFSLSSPTARTLDNRTLDAQLKALARVARRQLERAGMLRKVAVGFQTVRGNVGKEIANAIKDSDLVIVEGTGRLHARYYRAQSPDQVAARSVLGPILLLKGGKPLARQFTIIGDSVENALKCLRAAASLTQNDNHEMIILPCAETPADGEKLAAELADALHGAGFTARISAPAGLEAAAVLQRIGAGDTLLVAADYGPLLKDEADAHRLFECRHPLLLVH